MVRICWATLQYKIPVALYFIFSWAWKDFFNLQYSTSLVQWSCRNKIGHGTITGPLHDPQPHLPLPPSLFFFSKIIKIFAITSKAFRYIMFVCNNTSCKFSWSGKIINEWLIYACHHHEFKVSNIPCNSIQLMCIPHNLRINWNFINKLIFVYHIIKSILGSQNEPVIKLILLTLTRIGWNFGKDAFQLCRQNDITPPNRTYLPAPIIYCCVFNIRKMWTM